MRDWVVLKRKYTCLNTSRSSILTATKGKNCYGSQHQWILWLDKEARIITVNITKVATMTQMNVNN